METPMLAVVPSNQTLGEALSFMIQGWGACILVLIVGWMIAKQQFPDKGDLAWRFIVVFCVFFFFVGMGGMDWWTFGEWQGLPWENSGGSTGWRYDSGGGWSR